MIFKILQVPASTSQTTTGPRTSQNVRSRMDSSDPSSELFLEKRYISIDSLFILAPAPAYQKIEKGNYVTNFEIQLRQLKKVRITITRYLNCLYLFDS